MIVTEATLLEDWLDIHHPDCESRHCKRGCISTTEMLHWLKTVNKVELVCNNIWCHQNWQIFKFNFFIDDTTVISHLKCPRCNKLNVTATWAQILPESMGQYQCGMHWIWDVVNITREYEGERDPLGINPISPIININDYIHAIIIHSQQQYILNPF